MQVALVLAGDYNRINVLGHELVNDDDGIGLYGTSRKRKECEGMHGKRVDVRMENERMEHSQRVAEMKCIFEKCTERSTCSLLFNFMV